MSEAEKRQFNTTTQTNWDEPPAGAEYWRGRCRDCHHLLSEHEPSWACYVPAATGFTIDGPAVEQAVPVAWRIRRPPRTIWDVCQLRTAYARNHWQRKGYEVEPLYTHPPATDEALREAGEVLNGWPEKLVSLVDEGEHEAIEGILLALANDISIARKALGTQE